MRTSLCEHTIDTGDSKPSKQRPRPVPIALAEEERNAVLQMKEQGEISVLGHHQYMVFVRGKMA